MHVYRIHFTWKEKEYTLKAESLDMSHPYFVSIKGLLLPEKRSILVDIADNELRDLFRDTRHLMIPFQSVSMIEELEGDPDTMKHQGSGVVLMKREKEQADEK